MRSVESAGIASAADEYHPSPKGEPPKAVARGVFGHGQDVLQGTEGPAVAQGSQAQTGVRRLPDAPP